MSNEHRLPRTAIPSRYDIRLAPDLESFTFEGRVKIALDVPTETDRLVLNAIELTIHEATIIADDGSRRTASVTHDHQAQRIALRFDRPLPAGSYSLRIRFAGILNDQLHGFYRSTFTDTEGSERVVALTQFESTDARRAFPCWDEPEYKAVFGVKLDIDPALAAFSNGPEVRRRTLEDGRVRITFGDTMRMSTYLVAMVVGPLEATDAIDVDGVPTRIAHPTGKGHLTAWAEECAEWFLRWLSEYYGIPYPGDKVDHVAVPDFAFGAMENLGCITYRETALLLDPETSGQYQRRRIADVIAHELAHMWFGDLVTMKWWDGIWLNEAFASFMEMKAVEAKHPEWDRWLAFAADRGAERFDALIVDALAASRPVEFEVGSPQEADEMFDALTYGKGSAVLRMIEQFIGEDAFRDGVGRYLRDHAYGNTETSDLWAALDQASDYAVGEIMDTWILQAGYPLIEVRPVEGGLRLSQRRFLLIPDETDQTTFQVPIHLRYAVDGEVREQPVLLVGDELTVDVGDVDWVVANGGGHGFYRVAYEPSLLDALVGVAPTLSPLERFTLLDDIGWLAVSGDMALADWFKLAGAFTEEKAQPVWQMVFSHLGDLDQMVPDADRPAFQRRVAALLAETAERLGTEPEAGEHELDTLLRSQVLTALGCIADEPATVRFALDHIDEVLDDFGSLDPDVTSAVLAIAGAHGNADMTDRMVGAHRTAPTAQLGQQLLAAAARTRDPEAAVRVVDAALDGPIRKQDTAWVMARLVKNRHVRPAAWRRIRDRFGDIISGMPPMTQRHLAEGFTAVTEPALAREISAFLAETGLPSATKAVAQALERMEANVAFAERETPRLADTLA